jgi:DNA modification methylase
LQDLDDASVDSVVTDPPYEIGFMGKAWDSTGIAYNVQLWRECLRVLKPGGHLLAFGATRSYHRMAVAIEDAGFEIRDSIHWTYGSGFPKSLDVSKAIDKAAGATRKVVGSDTKARSTSGLSALPTVGGETIYQTWDITVPASPAAVTWAGWGTALKPSHEPIVVARKPIVGTVASNVLQFGTGALNIDGTRVGSMVETWPASRNYSKAQMSRPGSTQAEDAETQPTGPAPAGRWPANTVLTHAADCKQTGETTNTLTGGFGNGGIGMSEIGEANQSAGKGAEWINKTTSVPVFVCVPGCPVPELDKQSGPAGAQAPASGPSYSGPSKSNSMAGAFKGNGDAIPAFHADKGGASRFFTQTQWTDHDWIPFCYMAKPGKKERNAGLDKLPAKPATGSLSTHPKMIPASGQATYQNFHPTVKPVELMRYLIKLVTPVGGTVLDPFLGSGTTAVAAELDGYKWVGCELTNDYLAIIQGRVQHANQQRENQLFN